MTLIPSHRHIEDRRGCYTCVGCQAIFTADKQMSKIERDLANAAWLSEYWEHPTMCREMMVEEIPGDCPLCRSPVRYEPPSLRGCGNCKYYVSSGLGSLCPFSGTCHRCPPGTLTSVEIGDARLWLSPFPGVTDSSICPAFRLKKSLYWENFVGLIYSALSLPGRAVRSLHIRWGKKARAAADSEAEYSVLLYQRDTQDKIKSYYGEGGQEPPYDEGK